MGNKPSNSGKSSLPPPKLKPLEESLTEIIARAIKKNDIRFKDLDRFSQRISIFDINDKNNCFQLIDKGLKIKEIKEINDEKKQEIDEDEEKWKRIKNIMICVSQLYSKYNVIESNDIYHNAMCNILNYCNNFANKSNELCSLIMNKNDNFINYNAFNILSALCQSNAQIAFSYMTFQYFAKYGHDEISDVPSDNGWQTHIYFNWNNTGNIRILNKKQGRESGNVQNKTDILFILDWEMDAIYNKEAIQCLSVELKSNGFSYFNPKLKKKQKEKISTDLKNGEYIVYKYDAINILKK